MWTTSYIEEQMELVDLQIQDLKKQLSIWEKERDRLFYRQWCDMHPQEIMEKGDKIIITQQAKNSHLQDGFLGNVGDELIIEQAGIMYPKHTDVPHYTITSLNGLSGTGRTHYEVWPMRQAWLDRH